MEDSEKMKIYLGLICKVGTPRTVLKKLRALNIPGGDIFLLFGPLDILIEFTNVNNLDDYLEQWLNPISNIGAEESLISQTISFIVGYAGPAIHHIPYAIVFINTKPIEAENVRRCALSIPGVLSADFILGPYDVVCPIRATDMTDLERIVLNLQTNVPGIKRTMTCLVKEVY
jgi:DNA-binding Lrp family transcriptional regulator